MKYIFFTVLFFSFILSYGQRKYAEGYYITNTNDTVHAELNRVSPWELRVKGKGKIPFESYKSYYFIEDGRKFIWDEVLLNTRGKRDRVALEVLMEGEPSLYHHKSRLYAGTINGPKYFLSKKKSMTRIDEKLYEKSVNGYAGTLGFLMKDCDMKSNLESMPYSYKSISESYAEYYQCSGNDYTSYGQFLQTVVVSVGPAIALTSQTKTLNIERRMLDEVELSSNNTVSYGLTGLLKFPRWTNKIALEFGYHRIRSDFTGEKTVKDYNLFIDYDMTESTRESYFSLGVRYQLPQVVSPYVGLSLILGSIKNDGISYTAEAVRRDLLSGAETRVPIEPGVIDAGYKSIFPGIGLSGGFEVYTKRVRPYLEYRFNSFSNIGGNTNVNSSTSIRQSQFVLGARIVI